MGQQFATLVPVKGRISSPLAERLQTALSEDGALRRRGITHTSGAVEAALTEFLDRHAPLGAAHSSARSQRTLVEA